MRPRNRDATRPMPPGSDDREHCAWLERIAGGDRVAFERLYIAFHGRLARFLARLLGRSELVDEVLNDVMYAVWRQACSFRGDSRVSTWILGIAYRTGLKALRTDARAGRRGAWMLPLPDEPEGPDAAISQNDLKLWVAAALAKLPVDQRMVVELAFFGDHSYRDIARIVGCPQNTVKTRMFHARRKLKQLLPRLAAADGTQWSNEANNDDC